MAKPKRLSKVARELNLGISTIVDFLGTKGIEVESNPNAKIDGDTYEILVEEFQSDKSAKAKSDELSKKKAEVKETISIDDAERKPIKKEEEQETIIIKNLENVTPAEPEEEKVEEKPTEPKKSVAETGEVRVLGSIDLDTIDKKRSAKKEEPVEEKKPVKETPAPKTEAKVEEPKSSKPEHITTKIDNLGGPTVVGKIELPVSKPKEKKPVASSTDSGDNDKKKKA